MKNVQLPNGHGRLICKYCRNIIHQCACSNHLKETFGVCSTCESKEGLSPRDKYMHLSTRLGL